MEKDAKMSDAVERVSEVNPDWRKTYGGRYEILTVEIENALPEIHRSIASLDPVSRVFDYDENWETVMANFKRKISKALRDHARTTRHDLSVLASAPLSEIAVCLEIAMVRSFDRENYRMMTERCKG